MPAVRPRLYSLLELALASGSADECAGRFSSRQVACEQCRTQPRLVSARARSCSAVPTHSDLQQWRDRLDRLGEPHGGIVVGHIGWVIAGVHDPDGIEVRLYTVERHDGQ